jgi:chemotaxis protein MotB
VPCRSFRSRSAKIHADDVPAGYARAALIAAQKAQSELAGKAKDAEKKAKEADAVQAKLKAAVDKSSGSVSQEGEEIHLQLVDKVLFKVGDDQLTDRGKAVLAKVAAALKDLPDKQVWVQGHTDDQPIFVPPPPKKPPPKGAPPPAPPRFATNWELSAARALTVVHYLQDTAKLDPSRLAALAFGQYRPVSRSNKAANRRIEIVLYPHRAVIERK